MANKDEFEVLNEMSEELTIQLDDTRTSAVDLESSFDIASDTSMDVADQNEKLAKAVKQEVHAVTRSVEMTDTVSYNKRDELRITQQYQDAMLRRTEIEGKLASQQELIDYTQTNPAEYQKTNPDAPIAQPKTYAESLKEYLDDNLKSQKQIQEDLFDKGEEARKKRYSRFEKLNPRGAMERLEKNKTSTLGRIIGGTMGAGMDLISSSIGSVLNDIPGLKQISGATKFVYQSLKETGENRRRKALEPEATRLHSEQRDTLTSKFERTYESGDKPASSLPSAPAPISPQDKGDSERAKKKDDEEKAERDKNDQERDESGKRHSGLMKWLRAFQAKMVLTSLFGALSSLAGSTLGVLTTISAGIATVVTGLTSGLFASKFASKISETLGRVFRKPGEVVNGSDKTKTKPKPKIDPKPNASDTTKTGGGDPKSKPKKTNWSKFTKILKGPTVKAGAKAMASMGLRFIPGVGAALMAYEIGSFIEEKTGFFSSAGDMISGAASDLFPDAGTSEKQTGSDAYKYGTQHMKPGESTSDNLAYQYQATRQVEKQAEERVRAESMADMSTIIKSDTVSNSYNKTTNIMTQPFNFANEEMMNNMNPSHGAQLTR